MAAPQRTELRDRLAAARSDAELEAILGRRRQWFYSAGFLGLAAAAAVAAAYLVAHVVLRRSSVWVLAALRACVSIVAFFAVIGYASAYAVATGRRPWVADRASRIAERLNSNV